MLSLFGTIFFLAGGFFAFISIPMAAIGAWIIALLCALGSIENQLIKQRKLTAITVDQLEELIDIQKPIAQAHKKDLLKKDPRYQNQA